MHLDTLKYLCKTLAKGTSCGVRLYCGTQMLFYYSIYDLEPDPVMSHLEEILNSKVPAGVLITPLFQFYSYVFYNDYCIILGPTATFAEDCKQLDTFMFLLDVAEDNRKSYIEKLACAPNISLQRMTWITAYVYTSLHNTPLSIEEVALNIRSKSHSYTIARETAAETLRVADDHTVMDNTLGSYNYELVLVTCIEHGRPEQLSEMFDATPQFQPGKLAPSSLRQIKNVGICAATVSSRAAIAGGISPPIAFRLSDIYIQKFEMLQDHNTILQLTNEMIIDFAQRVKDIKHTQNKNTPIFHLCSTYITKNIFTEITVEKMAKDLCFSRPYLCNRFKTEAGIPLSLYIQKEKVLEAKRFLEFTDKTLAEISSQLSFSSQSYFQSVFKKITGETPRAYRTKKRHIHPL